MSFDGITFWILFALIWVLYWRLPKKPQNWLLLAASIYFYSAWDIKFTILLVVSSLIDFKLALAIYQSTRENRRRMLMWTSVCINIGLLIFFKYYLIWVNQAEYVHTDWFKFESIYRWGLPLGISFYTFQILSYTIDVYRGKVRPTDSFSDFVLFVSFFPQLVTGPIEKARHLLPQIETSRHFDLSKIEQGFYLALWGLFKTIYIANGLVYPINSYFDQSGPMEATATLSIFFLMTLQVYANFSGYSDMARGLGRMLGFEITINFKPFWTARNPSEFWQRWNISLIRWLREYVFDSLRKHNEYVWSSSIKIILILTLVGLWHAMSINWLIFGIFNGFIVILYYLSKKFKLFPRTVGAILMFGIYLGNGLLYCTPTLERLHRNLASLGDWNSFLATMDLWTYSAWFLVPLFVIESVVKFHDPEAEKFISRWAYKILFCTLCLTGIIILERTTKLGFTYFEF